MAFWKENTPFIDQKCTSWKCAIKSPPLSNSGNAEKKHFPPRRSFLTFSHKKDHKRMESSAWKFLSLLKFPCPSRWLRQKQFIVNTCLVSIYVSSIGAFGSKLENWLWRRVLRFLIILLHEIFFIFYWQWSMVGPLLLPLMAGNQHPCASISVFG